MLSHLVRDPNADRPTDDLPGPRRHRAPGVGGPGVGGGGGVAGVGVAGVGVAGVGVAGVGVAGSGGASARRLLVVPVAALAGVVLDATPAFAHTDAPGAGVSEGFWHPITGPDHLVAMVAVGIVAAAMAFRGRVWMAPGAFLAGMVLGGVGGMAGLVLPQAELLIVASVILLGLAIAGAVEAKGRWFGATLAMLVVSGLAHGNAHGAEAPEAANPVAYVVGFLVATTLLHVAGVGVGTVIRDRRTVRFGMGLATVAAGALFLA